MRGHLLLIVLLQFPTTLLAQTCAKGLGETAWATRNGFQVVTYDTLSILSPARTAEYTRHRACDCSGRCDGTHNCTRWAVAVRYLGTTTTLNQKCDASGVNKERCGFTSQCYLKNDAEDVYDGRFTPSITDGYSRTVTGLTACPPASTPCAGYQCCLPGRICHDHFGCLNADGPDLITLASSPFTGAKFIAPFILSLLITLLAVIARLITMTKKGTGKAGRKLGRVRLAARWLFEMAALVFVLAEFIISFDVLSKVVKKDYGHLQVSLLESNNYDATTKLGEAHDCFIQLNFIRDRPLPQVINTLGRRYVVHGEIFAPAWNTGFQYTLYPLLCLQLGIHLLTVVWKLWLIYKVHMQGEPTSRKVELTAVFVDFFLPLEVNFILEPMSRAWEHRLFETNGMSAPYMTLMVFYLISQVLFFATLFYLKHKKNFNFLTLERETSHWFHTFIVFVNMPGWFFIMVLLSFIYKSITPAGPARWRTWYYYLCIVGVFFIRNFFTLIDLCRGKLDHEESVNEQQARRARAFQPVLNAPPIRRTPPANDDVVMATVMETHSP